MPPNYRPIRTRHGFLRGLLRAPFTHISLEMARPASRGWRSAGVAPVNTINETIKGFDDVQTQPIIICLDDVVLVFDPDPPAHPRAQQQGVKHPQAVLPRK